MKVTSHLGTWVHSITMLGYYDYGRNAHNERFVYIVCNYMILNPTHNNISEIVNKRTIKCAKIHPCTYIC